MGLRSEVEVACWWRISLGERVSTWRPRGHALSVLQRPCHYLYGNWSRIPLLHPHLSHRGGTIVRIRSLKSHNANPSPQMQGRRRTQRMLIRQKERSRGAAQGPDPSNGSSAVSNKKNKHSARFQGVPQCSFATSSATGSGENVAALILSYQYPTLPSTRYQV
jgi:hypothetical protein